MSSFISDLPRILIKFLVNSGNFSEYRNTYFIEHCSQLLDKSEQSHVRNISQIIIRNIKVKFQYSIYASMPLYSFNMFSIRAFRAVDYL